MVAINITASMIPVRIVQLQVVIITLLVLQDVHFSLALVCELVNALGAGCGELVQGVLRIPTEVKASVGQASMGPKRKKAGARGVTVQIIFGSVRMRTKASFRTRLDVFCSTSRIAASRSSRRIASRRWQPAHTGSFLSLTKGRVKVDLCVHVTKGGLEEEDAVVPMAGGEQQPPTPAEDGSSQNVCTVTRPRRPLGTPPAESHSFGGNSRSRP